MYSNAILIVDIHLREKAVYQLLIALILISFKQLALINHLHFQLVTIGCHSKPHVIHFLVNPVSSLCNASICRRNGIIAT